MARYKLGQSVIVTTSEKNQVGVIVETFTHNKARLYDVLLESRSAISAVNSSSNKNIYINRELTKKLCESGEITPTIDYNYMLDNELLPRTRC
jgi:hypothetical protein